MVQYSENVQVKLSKDEKYYLDVISTKYRYKRCDFIRDAIREKMERDIPKLRIKYKVNKEKEYYPF